MEVPILNPTPPRGIVQIRHLVYFGTINLITLGALIFQGGIASQRLVAVEIQARENARNITLIQETGTPAYRVWTDTVTIQLHDIQSRLDRIERQR